MSIEYISSCHTGLPDNTKLSELINLESRTWNRHLLEAAFLQSDVVAISSISLGSSSNINHIVWHYTKNGLFSIWSAYFLELESQRATVENTNGAGPYRKTYFRFIWTCKLSLKLKSLFRGFVIISSLVDLILNGRV
ncbi:hypothetical protein CDL12_13742 [Handroanthus impetiginosus]|uniref:Uncharacterized protein n=1 Tax=Handroanthus impetiginosus TaxID=429701 RepID=A0A2G9H7Z1_9LAMI|nr:hypothetical protein CDL12_13742 [Handroanthus impetiginosus]